MELFFFAENILVHVYFLYNRHKENHLIKLFLNVSSLELFSYCPVIPLCIQNSVFIFSLSSLFLQVSLLGF